MKERAARREGSTKESKRGEVGRTHEGTRAHYRFHNRSRKKRKKRKGGTSFSNSKQRRRREQKKKEETWIEGRRTPTDSQNTCAEDKGGLNLISIAEEAEDSGSQALSMEESENPNSSNQSGSRDERRDNSIITVSLS